jgi:N-acetylglucosamine-6-sulfatase
MGNLQGTGKKFSVRVKMFGKRKWVCLFAAMICCFFADAAKKPDIVFIMTDDQAADAVTGGRRFPFFETPNLDRLAASGVTFENAFVTTSICSPSRATCLTGLYSHKTGVPTNDPARDPAESVTLVSERLQAAGYETAFVGKWHMAATDKPRRGFDHWVSFEGQGVYENPLLNVNGTHVQESGYTTDLLTDYAEEWIRTRSADRPFALFLWHKAPHAKFIAAPRHKGLYAEETLKEPPNFRDSYSGKPEWQRRGLLYGLHESVWNKSLEKPVPPQIGLLHSWDDLWRKYNYLEYLRVIKAVDESTGRVLDTLTAVNRRDNSLILYTSDNGFNVFAHQSLIDKRNMWEESIRIPLFIDFPGTSDAGMSSAAMVLNVDFVPTLLDAAGIAVPDDLDGRPLQPLIAGAPADWRDHFFYLYQQEDYAPGIVTMLGVRTERFKYIHYPDTPEQLDELFDLTADPYEMKNFFNDPAYADVQKEMGLLLKTAAGVVHFQGSENLCVPMQ